MIIHIVDLNVVKGGMHNCYTTLMLIAIEQQQMLLTPQNKYRFQVSSNGLLVSFHTHKLLLW